MNVNAPQDPQTPVPQATAREFLAVVFRRKWLIIGLFAVTTLTVLAVALGTPVVYTSSSRVLIHRGEPQSLLTGYRTVFNDWEADLASEIEVARSYPVLQSARELLKADPKGASIRMNARQVDVEVMGKSNVLALAYQDGDPEVAQQVCDALTRAYIDYRQNAMTLNYPQGFFRREIDKVRADLETWMEKRRRYAAENDIVDVDQQNRMLLDERSTLQKKLTDLQTDLAQNQTVYAVMEDMRDHPSVDLPSLGPNMSGDALLEMKRRVLEQESRVALIRERYRDDSPEVMAANATLDTLRSLLRREVGSRMELSKSRLTSLEAGIAVVQHQLDANQRQLDSMPPKAIAIAQMDREIAVLKERYESLSKDSDQARVTENVTPTVSVVLLSPAGRAVSKSTRDYVRLALAPAFSLVVGIGLAFFMDGLDVTVRTSGHAEEAIELPVLAALNERRRVRGVRTR
jgi:uncharacterized protein involved in exopolysaccharide biosynthesis